MRRPSKEASAAETACSEAFVMKRDTRRFRAIMIDFLRKTVQTRRVGDRSEAIKPEVHAGPSLATGRNDGWWSTDVQIRLRFQNSCIMGSELVSVS